MQVGDRILLEWSDGSDRTAIVRECSRNVMTVIVPTEDDEEYMYERGSDGFWYDVNDSQTPVTVTVRGRNRKNKTLGNLFDEQGKTHWTESMNNRSNTPGGLLALPIASHVGKQVLTLCEAADKMHALGLERDVWAAIKLQVVWQSIVWLDG